MTDGKGKVRVAWLQRLESLVNTAKALHSLPGLERRTKDINPTMVLERYTRTASRAVVP